MNIGLTPRARELLCYLSEREMCPSYAEVCTALGWPSKTSVVRAVRRLERGGYIRRLPNKVRAIEVLPTPVIINGERYRFIPISRSDSPVSAASKLAISPFREPATVCREVSASADRQAVATLSPATEACLPGGHLAPAACPHPERQAVGGLGRGG